MKNIKKGAAAFTAVILALSLTACTGNLSSQLKTGESSSEENIVVLTTSAKESTESSAGSENTADSSAAAGNTADSASESNGEGTVTEISGSANGLLSAEDLFTDRDLRQEADLSEAVSYTLSDGQTVTITEEGVYVFSGTASNAQILVEASGEAKVQIVLDGVTITNDSIPAIYVKSADKVFVTTTSTENTLSVTGTFTSDGDTNTDAVIFSKDDLVLNGVGTLMISSADNGVTSKDDLKVTGGTIGISSSGHAMEANDSVVIADGNIAIRTNKDGLHADNEDDATLGYIYICGGTISIESADDAIHGTGIVQIDGGELTLSAAEGLEGTYIQINGGTIDITASGDGVNAARKSDAYTPTFEMNGGSLTIEMGSGDTDAVDSNGNLYINGGTLTITAQSPFDYDGTGELNGGTLIVNGQEVTSLSNQMMGGGQMGGGQNGGSFGGQMGGGFRR